MSTDRRSQVIVFKLRVGHTYLTHSYLIIDKRDTPVFEEGQTHTALTIPQLLLEYQRFKQIRHFNDTDML